MFSQSPFVFSSRQDFISFWKPKGTSETPEWKRNCAQKSLIKRLSYLASRPAQTKKTKLNEDFEKEWSNIQTRSLLGGDYESWWNDNFAKEEDTTQFQKDVILLVEAFGDKELAWRFCQYPDIEKFVKRPHEYEKLLEVVIGQESATQSRTEQGQTLVKRTRADQPAPKAPATECTDFVSNVLGKRQTDGESPEGKRVCLPSERSATPQVNGTEIISAGNAITASVSGAGQEPRMPTSSEQQTDIIKAPAPMEPYSKHHKLIWSKDTPLDFHYYGQSDRNGTNDCNLEYLWAGYDAAKFLMELGYENEEDEMICYYKIFPEYIAKLPFKDLVDSIKRSETWKQHQNGKGSECLTIQVSHDGATSPSPQPPYCYGLIVKCTVPKHEAPKKQVPVP